MTVDPHVIRIRQASVAAADSRLIEVLAT